VRPGTTECTKRSSPWGTVGAMRRPQSAFGLAAVTASLFVATLAVGPVDAAVAPATADPTAAYAAPAACTRWSSESAPPATIRVLRTKRSLVSREVAGSVQEVDFRDYVATTMAVEWPEHYPIETLKAGAVATKQFAWYHVIHPRGRTVEVPDEDEEDGTREVCYDVVDTTVDQYYYPEKHGPGERAGPGSKIRRAIDQTWDVTVRKYSPKKRSSRFFLTGYRSGTAKRCGADANGFKLFHTSTRACGRDGLTFRQILNLYLRPNLEIVTVGRHDVIGSRHGDAAAMVRDADGVPVARLWTLVRPGGATRRGGVRIASEQLTAYQSADMDRDGKDDLVWLIGTGARQGRIRVALSDGSGYGEPRTWYEGDFGAPLARARLVVGDFHADGRPDVGVLARSGSGSHVQLMVARKRSGNALSAPTRWWSGAADIDAIAAAWAGDVSGDGRADLIVREHPAGGGVRFRTAITKSPPPAGDDRMRGFRLAWESAKLQPGKVRSIAADANRDGREDILLLVGGDGRPRVERLQGQPLGKFVRGRIWTAPRNARIPVSSTRLGAADADDDGRTDLVLFSKHADGTRIRVLKTRYDSMRAGMDIVEDIDYDDVRPY
jgi:hypothetical protein